MAEYLPDAPVQFQPSSSDSCGNCPGGNRARANGPPASEPFALNKRCRNPGGGSELWVGQRFDLKRRNARVEDVADVGRAALQIGLPC
jgi:hypothetical protein